MLSVSQLSYIVAVARAGHFGKAARACHISQPSLSMQILKAEREAGFALFDRLKRPVTPTEKGRAFIAQAHAVLEAHERLRHLTQSDREVLSGSLRLGVIPTLAPYLIPLFIQRFSERCPKVHLTVEELPTAVLVQRLRDGTIDAAIAATPLHETGIEESPLFVEPFYLYAHAEDALLKKMQVTTNDLKRKDVWLLADGHCLRSQVLRLCGSKRTRPTLANVSFEGGTLETLRQSIRHNGGATLVPELFVRELSPEERRAAVRPFIAPVPSRQISLLKRPRSWQTRLMEALERSILESLPADLQRPATTKIISI